MSGHSRSARRAFPDCMQPYSLSDFDFDLPPELIAQMPAERRAASRLLVVEPAERNVDPAGRTEAPAASATAPDASSRARHDRATAGLHDRTFTDLPSLLDPGDVIVFNDTRVIRARLHGAKASGGKVEVMVERIVSAREALVQVRASHAPQPGSTIHIGDEQIEVLARDERLFHVRVVGTTSLEALLERHGEVPLPPYIARPAGDADSDRYQTVYARAPGAVAAPTAGLHFDPPLIDALRARGVETAFLTLHVGLGTFLPVQSETLSEHRMHSEWFDLPASTVDAIARARARGSRIVAVGTTTLRALESAAAEDGTLAPGPRETALFITPGYRFRVIDRLLTNFHLPKSTLLMLVSAFAGYDRIRAAYAHAIEQRYRFFSYGDAMLLTRTPG